MSPRRHRRRGDEPSGGQPAGGGTERTEEWPDGVWVVRDISGAGSTKAYRCPGCEQEIVAGVAHVVAWRADGVGVFGGPE
ncbi:MAG TPA: hypothetical protein VGR21_06840, partial [Cryptosporangiaceae bacterium]|nr:hypothetical protein [Cryptosporangiaceae bacterium]